MDNILTSTVTYRVNAQINDISLDECSFISSYDEVRPYFDVSVSKDLDVTGLVVFLRNSMGTVVSSRFNYTNDYEDLDEPQSGVGSEDTVLTQSNTSGEIIIPVESLDGILPAFPIPEDLPVGRYTIVFQVMREREILQRTERPVYYLGRVNFSYNGINVYLPGIIDSDQIVPKEAVPRGTVVMLEADVEFGSSLDPYIVWYEDRRKISEGKFSEGAGQLFWRVPERSGFINLRAEILPVDYSDLKGYQKEVSVFVPSRVINVNLISNNVNELINWYVFEGNLRDSIAINSTERNLLQYGNDIKWLGENGIYGAATGNNNLLMLPKISVLNYAHNNWQILFRMFPAANGRIFTIFFDSGDVSVQLSVEDHYLELSLVSPLKTVSQRVSLPYFYFIEDGNLSIDKDFIVAGINFSVISGLLSAQINISGNYIDIRSAPISLETDNIKNFQIVLGFNKSDNPDDDSETSDFSEITAIWDEFALYFNPDIDALIEDIDLHAVEALPAFTDTNDDS